MKELLFDVMSSIPKQKLDLYKTQSYVQTRLITPKSCIEISNNKINKKMLISCSSYEIPKYFKNQTLYINEYKYKYQQMNHIPINHITMSIICDKYKLHNKSNVTFVVETINNELTKCYFNIIGNENDIMIKDDIFSFLSILS